MEEGGSGGEEGHVIAREKKKEKGQVKRRKVKEGQHRKEGKRECEG